MIIRVCFLDKMILSVFQTQQKIFGGGGKKFFFGGGGTVKLLINST